MFNDQRAIDLIACNSHGKICLIIVLIGTHHVGERAANPAQCPLSAAVMHVCLILCLRAYRCKDAAGTGTPVSTAASAA